MTMKRLRRFGIGLATSVLVLACRSDDVGITGTNGQETNGTTETNGSQEGSEQESGDGDPTGDGDGDPTGDGDGDPTGDGDGDPTDVPCSDLPSDELGLDDNAVSLDDVASTFDGSCGGDGPDALYRFTAPSDGTYTFTLNSGEFDGVLYLVGPSCAPLEEIDCALADVELVALLLGGGRSLQRAQAVLEAVGGLGGLSRACAHELREISGYPNDNTYKVVGEIVTEFALDNTIVREHKLLDILDPYRIASQDFHNAFYAQLFGPMTKDWAHVNGVIYDDSDDSFVVSSRHQDLVFKLDRQTGALVWLIGTPHASSAVDDSWPFLELVGDGALPNHMHAPQVLPEGHLMVFDNNNKGRASRAVEYAIDVDAMTIEQVWEYSDPDYDPAIFSIFIGDADTQANGNVLIDFGATLVDPTSLDTRGAYAHIIEVDRATGDKVFELDVRGAEGDEKQRLVYRADRQPSLYAL